MTLLDAIACAAALAFLAFGLVTTLTPARAAPASPAAPLVTAGALLAFSIVPLLREGPGGLRHALTATWWSTQVWLDFLLIASVAWVLALPRMRRVGMRPLGWLVAIAALGSLALLPMLARLLQLERGTSAAADSQAPHR